MKTKQLRLILGDQLNENHSWFSCVDDEIIYLIAELHQEASYVKHHIQKMAAFFAAMAEFANNLREKGHKVIHLTLDDSAKTDDMKQLIHNQIELHQSQSFSYQRPDEFRLRRDLQDVTNQLCVDSFEVDTEHFLLPFAEIPNHFKKNSHVRMESFYRYMRKRFSILMDGQKPVGGAWNFDANNRKSFKQSDIKAIPKPLLFDNPAQSYLDRIKQHNIATIGREAVDVSYPVSRQQSLSLLSFFCQTQLPNFGNFQDAMTAASPYAWSLYHSRLSFSLNTKMLSPKEVIDSALKAFQAADGLITLPQVEGFIRQILGWREYVRGMYWTNMPSYSQQNHLDANRALPTWFWNGDTKMHCMKKAISQSLEHAYAHHIQRLMITGNFALLAGIEPQQVDEWYLGIYIDAIEWVELPNTRGMALFADGGWIATKPYAASGNYVNKMSDYCKSCHYNVKDKFGESACPLNSLYWNFIDRHYDKFSSNHRLSFPIRNLDKMAETEKVKIRVKAADLLDNIEQL